MISVGAISEKVIFVYESQPFQIREGSEKAVSYVLPKLFNYQHTRRRVLNDTGGEPGAESCCNNADTNG